MRNWQAWTCTLITFTGSGTIRSSIKQLQCNAYYFTGPKKDGPLDIELEAASVEELLDDSLAPRLLPEPLEDQGGSDASRGDGRELPLGVSGEQEDGLGQACPR